jgi:ribosomal protein S2
MVNGSLAMDLATFYIIRQKNNLEYNTQEMLCYAQLKRIMSNIKGMKISIECIYITNATVEEQSVFEMRSYQVVTKW